MKKSREIYEQTQVKNRLHIIGSIWLVFLFGIPIWWKTTEVYRASLPYKEVQKWSSPSSLNMQFSISLSYIIPDDISSDFNFDTLKTEIQSEFDKNNLFNNSNSTERLQFDEDDLEYSYPPQVGFNFKVNTKITKKWKSDINIKTMIDEKLEDLLYSEKEDDDYLIHILKQNPKAKSYADVYVGKNKQIMIYLKEFNKESLIKYSVPVILNMFANEQSEIISSFTEERNENKSKEEIEKMRAFKYAPNYQLIYSLFNGNLHNFIVNWDIDQAINLYLKPFFDTLSSISTFEISSQIQNFASLSINPKSYMKDNKQIFYLEAKDLGHFINSAEWNLASPVSNSPPINLILYTPSFTQSPLYIHDSNAEILKTNAFLIPRWGGVVIENKFNNTQLNSDEVNTYVYSVDDLHPIMELFLSQLRELLDIKEIKFLPTDLPRNVRVAYGIDTTRGITSWELDQLLRKRTIQNLVNASRTLNSLAKLVGSLPNMVVLDKIKEKVVYALESLDMTYKEIDGGNYQKVFSNSKNALIAAEEAFFDPSMVSMLYFPDEHKYAVYLPLFLPISVPLALVLKEEFKKKKKRNEKDQKKNNEIEEIKENEEEEKDTN